MNRETTCCFTGHRPEKLPWREDEGDPRCLELKARLAGAVEAARRAAGPGDKGIADRLLPAAGPAARGFSADSESFGIQTVIDGLHVVPSCIGFPVDKPILLHALSHRPDRAGPVPRSVCIDGLGRKKDPMG